MEGVDLGAVDDMEVEVVIVAMVRVVVANGDVVEGAMVITHINSLAGT